MDGGLNNMIIGNDISNNSDDGIYLHNTSGNSIKNNNITSNHEGSVFRTLLGTYYWEITFQTTLLGL